MRGWISRHPIATFLIAIYALLIVAVAAESETPGAIVFVLTVLGLIVAGFGALLAAAYRAIFGKRRATRESLTSPQSAQSAPRMALQPAHLMPYPRPTSDPSPPPRQHTVRPIISAPSLGDVLMLTPTQFEDLSLNLLVALGYRDAKRQGGSGDLGADIICHDPQGRLTIAQCKRYAPGSSIGTPALQTFIGMKNVHHQADRGIFITTVLFSQPAIDLAKQHGIALIDGPTLLLLVHLTGVPLQTAAQNVLRCDQLVF